MEIFRRCEVAGCGMVGVVLCFCCGWVLGGNGVVKGSDGGGAFEGGGYCSGGGGLDDLWF